MSIAQKSNRYLYLVTIIGSLAGLLFGFDTGIISGALLFIEKDFSLTTTLKGFIVSSVLFGAMFGSISSGYLTDLFGRKRLMLIISALFIIGTLLASFANSINGILLGRILIGFAIGMGSYTAPLYLAEIAPTKFRGALVSLNQLAITLGILSSFLINYFFAGGEIAWRIVFLMDIIPAFLLSLGMFFLPESPRWLVKKNRKKEAALILERLRSSSNIQTEINEIEKSVTSSTLSFCHLFSSQLRPVLFLGIMLGFIQQITGINTIIYYAPTIFQMAIFSDTYSAILATVGIGIVNVLATLIAIFYLDKWGRRPLLLLGLMGMGISLYFLSFFLQIHNNLFLLRILTISCIFLYVISLAFSLGAILWLMVSEIFPLEIRGTAMSIAVFNCWLWNFIVSSSFLTILNLLGPSHTFLFYAAMCLLSLIFCYFKVPETKGASLEQIENNIRSKKPLRWLGQTETDTILTTD